MYWTDRYWTDVYVWYMHVCVCVTLCQVVCMYVCVDFTPWTSHCSLTMLVTVELVTVELVTVELGLGTGAEEETAVSTVEELEVAAVEIIKMVTMAMSYNMN